MAALVVAVALALVVLPLASGCGKNDNNNGSGAWPGSAPAAESLVGGDGQQAALRVERLITANEGVGEIVLATACGAWSGLDGEPFTGDDVIMDEVPITAVETNTVLADSPYPGGGPTLLSATSASTRAFSQRSPAAQGGGGGGAAGQNAGGGTSNAAGQGAGGVGGGGSNAGGQGAGGSGAGGSNAGGQGVGGSGAGSGAGGGGAGSAAGQNAGGSNVGGADSATAQSAGASGAAAVASPPGLGGNPPPGLPADGPPGLGGEPVPGVGNPVNSPAVTQKRIFDIVNNVDGTVTLTAVAAGECDVRFTALDAESGEPLPDLARVVVFLVTSAPGGTVDIDADSDNTGLVDGTDEEDDIEMDSPGMIVCQRPEPSEAGHLRPLVLRQTGDTMFSTLIGANIYVTKGEKWVRVLDSDGKTVVIGPAPDPGLSVDLAPRLRLGDVSLFVEGLEPGAAVIELVVDWEDPFGFLHVGTDKVKVTVVKVEFTEVAGLYQADGTAAKGYTSADNFGKVYSNRRLPNLTKEDDRQFVDAFIKIVPDKVSLPEGTRVSWTFEDPDDTSDDRGDIVAEARRLLDPNAGSGDDNSGSLDGHPQWENSDPAYDLVMPAAETKVKGGKSGVRFNVTDVGGDNFRVKAGLKLPFATDACWQEHTGVFTVWKRIDTEYTKMHESLRLDITLLKDRFLEAHVDFDVMSAPNSPEQPFLDGNAGRPTHDGYVKTNFTNLGKKQFKFLLAARALDAFADFDPETAPLAGRPKTSGVGEPATELVFKVKGGGLTPGAYPGRWLQPNSSIPAPSWTQVPDFPLNRFVRNTADVFFVHEITSHFPGGPTLDLQSKPIPNAGHDSPFLVTEDRITGLGDVDENKYALVFLTACKNHAAADPSKVKFDYVRDSTMVHEMVHAFGIHHLCGNMAVDGKSACVMQWSTIPVVKPDGTLVWQDLSRPNGPIRLCAPHLLAVRRSQGK